MKYSRISTFISDETRREFETFVRARGLKKGFVLERALQHHLRALKEIPEEYILPPTLVVSKASFEKILKGFKSPSSALRALMKGKTIPDDDLP
ncbi:MAG TPA: hypothetical protein VF950_08780 [Planctomycetota bacterium]